MPFAREIGLRRICASTRTNGAGGFFGEETPEYHSTTPRRKRELAVRCFRRDRLAVTYV